MIYGDSKPKYQRIQKMGNQQPVLYRIYSKGSQTRVEILVGSKWARKHRTPLKW